MNRTSFLVIVVVLFLQATTYAQKVLPQPVIPGQWIRSWLLCGPILLKDDVSGNWGHLPGFNTDYLTKAGGELHPTIKAGDVVKFTNGSAKWQLYHSPDSIIDLVKTLSKDAPALAYAYTEIQSDESKVWFMNVGSNDGCEIKVNGLSVWDYPLPRGLFIDDDVIPVLLKKGKNMILIKIEQRGNKWGFCVRFQPFSTAQLAERGEHLLRITTQENGEAVVASSFAKPVLQQLVQDITVEITDFHKKPVLKEQWAIDFPGKINLKSDDYQPYNGSIETRLKSGEVLRDKFSFFAGTRKDYVLFSNGQSAYRIALSRQASESEQWAAKELQHWIKEVSGVELPVQDISQPYRGPQVVIGYNDFIKEKTGVNAPADLDESFRYFNSGADLLIYGGKMRGTMYGVMAFLENEVGCRWYTPTVSVVPKKKELKFSWIEHSEKPGVRVRNDFYFEAFDPTWAARNRMNGTMGFRQQPGGVESYWGVHTFYPLMPPTEFYDKHQEYYSLINGKRIHERAQLCLTNPDVLKIITERIKKTIRENPEYLIYDVSQNDWYNPCECDNCQAIATKEGSESGVVIWFLNQVAESVEKEFPDKFIGTLAYQYTRTPPKEIRPRHNVVVRLCSIECCFAHDFKSCPENQSFLSDLKKWSALAPHLYIWDYVVNFQHYTMPYPNINVLQSNIQTFRDNHSIGIMEQAAYQSRGGEFSELKSYLISRLLWNPDCNADSTINEFLYGYYGRSGKYVRQYFDLLNSRITAKTHIHLGLTHEDQIFSDDFVKQSQRLFEEAEKVADNDEVLGRVEMASLPVLYLKCKRTPVLAKYDGTYLKFCLIAKREGINHYDELSDPRSFHLGVEGAK